MFEDNVVEFIKRKYKPTFTRDNLDEAKESFNIFVEQEQIQGSLKEAKEVFSSEVADAADFISQIVDKALFLLFVMFGSDTIEALLNKGSAAFGNEGGIYETVIDLM